MALLPKLPPSPPLPQLAGYVRHPFFRAFTRCFGMVFTKTDLDAFDSTCQKALGLLDGLLKSRLPLAGTRVFSGVLDRVGSSSVDSRVGSMVVSVVQVRWCAGGGVAPAQCRPLPCLAPHLHVP